MEGLFCDKRNESDEVNLTHAMTWKVTQRNAWKDIANWRIKQPNSYTKSQPCIDDHQFNKEKMGSVGESSKVCSQIVVQYCVWPALVGLIFYRP